MNNHTKTAALSFGNGQYRVIEEIGRGGMAVVYEVEDTRLRKLRALKILKANMAENSEIRERFESEAIAMAKIEDHSGIVRIYQVGEESDGRSWIVMELVDGCSLFDRLNYGILSPLQAVDVCLTVLSVLSFAHKHSIVHRDIKPQNILLAEDGQVKVMDFGIARVNFRDSNTRVDVGMGTPGFMSPEQRVNAKDVDVRADLYSVACVLYCCLIRGAINDVLPDLFAADVDPSILAEVPKSLVSVISKATRYRREERYASAEEMITALKEAREHLPLTPDDALPLMVPIVDEVVELSNEPSPTAVPEDSHGVFSADDVEVFEEVEGEPIDQTPPRYSWSRVVLIAVVSIAILIGGFWWFSRQTEKPIEVSAIPTVVVPESQEAHEVPEVHEAPKVQTQPIVVPPPEERKISTVVRTKPVTPIEPPSVVEVASATTTPVLQHQAPTTWPTGKAFTPEVKITGGQYRVKVYFRVSGTKVYASFLMTEKDGVWRASIPVESGASGFDYHVSAEPKDSSLPKLSSGSGFKPHAVKIK